MILLYAGGDRTADADTVAPHEDNLFLAVRIEKGCIERLGIFRAELEYMANLNAAPHFKSTC